MGTPWIGGPPLTARDGTWKGTARNSPDTPCCYRSIDPYQQGRSYNKRIEGNATKFKRDDPEYNLLAFANDALAHMEEHGMDTFFYLEGVGSPLETGKDLFRYHTKYTTSQVDDFIKECLGATAPTTVGTLDSYGIDALKDAGTWLMNSLDESLKATLHPLLPPRPYGPTVWMALVAEIQMDSFRRINNLVKKFEATKVADFKGENVRDYCTAVQDILQQLERDEQLPSTHLLTIVDAFCDVTVQDFKFGWMSRKKDINNFIRDSAGKDAAVVKRMPNYTHYSSLLKEAKEDYKNNLHRWGVDLQQEGKLAAMQSRLDRVNNQLTRVNQRLSQQTAPPPTPAPAQPAVKCATCNGNHATRDHDQVMAKRAANKIKFAPPKPGEPETKTIDGHTKHWCAKCGRNQQGRWTGHPTRDHRDDYTPPAGNGNGNGNNNGRRRHRQRRNGGTANLHELPNVRATASPPAAVSPTEGALPPISEPTFTHLDPNIWSSE
jgi:hypothetical protein